MHADREETFALEVPDQAETDLVSTIERSGGLKAYIGIALDLGDDLPEGTYRAAFTLNEARDLHNALGAALAGAPSKTA